GRTGLQAHTPQEGRAWRPVQQKSGPSIADWGKRLYRAGREVLAFPDRYTGWIVPAYRRAVQLLCHEGPWHAVLSVSPVVSAHLAALLLRWRFSRLVWFAQFHDPWSKNPFRQWPLASLARLEQSLEAAVIRRCDCLLAATEEATDQFSQAYP